MIKTRKELKACLKYEKSKYKLPKFSCLLASLGYSEISIIWKYQKRLRKWEYHHNAGHKFRALIAKAKVSKLSKKTGFKIHPNNFDVGLQMFHIGSILVNGDVRVGKDCCIHINTALVATGGTEDGPHIGDNCRIGVGATIVGGIKLGNDVVVGAGAVVTKSFEEDHITLGGVPAKIISHKAIM